jgi:hypothetical protein
MTAGINNMESNLKSEVDWGFHLCLLCLEFLLIIYKTQTVFSYCYNSSYFIVYILYLVIVIV